MAHWLRFQHQGESGFGQVQGDQIAVHAGDLFDQPRATGETLKLADVVIDIPCTPSKMVAMVDNFHALVTKLEHAVPAEPLYFLKGNNSFLAANQTIRTPKSYGGKVVYEGELGIVIGKPCHEAHETEAAGAIFGYTCINDLSERYLQLETIDTQYTKAKGFDNAAPIGPYLVTKDEITDPNNLDIKLWVNGVLRQDFNTRDYIHNDMEVVSYLSQYFKLYPGDTISMGSAPGNAKSWGENMFLKPNDKVLFSILGLGQQEQTVIVEEL